VNAVADLGGGYIDAQPDPAPAVAAILAAASPGSADAHLVVLAGPPGVGKSAVAERLVRALPHTFCLDKDLTAGGFVLQAALDSGVSADMAYGTPHYFSSLRPHEYAGPMAQACANLVGTRRVLLVGGWGPELGIPRLWAELRQRVAPARLTVIHLDPPPPETWRQRLAARGSRSDSPYFERFVQAVTSGPIWEGARCVPPAPSIAALAQNVTVEIFNSPTTT
jgi:hypothetical protein